MSMTSTSLRGDIRLTVALVVSALSACGGAQPPEDPNSGSSGIVSVGLTNSGVGTTASDDAAGDETMGEKFDVSMVDVLNPGMAECEGLVATIRDFSTTHVDFEAYNGSMAYTGLVLPELGADQTPQYNPGYTGQAMITSAQSFSEWYHDVAGVNEAFTINLPLTDEGDGNFVFDSNAFFPIDGMGYGNEGNEHNFHFTTEVHTSFTYSGGEIFTFRGDDDVWVFVNNQLALDLGGLHSVLEASIMMDTLGLTLGQTYPMDIFHAERHTTASNFRIVTTIDCFITPAG